ncbi:MAG TPA: hypothetical protein EYH06_00505 [Chromatiales bacterium]|nr:hypothetical protein [Thiotrichales bacterium]HIP67052.1 hypothetical protein [Chromatiales bacterium]
MLLEFVEGPLWYVALTIFVVGVIWRIFSIVHISIKKDLAPAKGSAVKGAVIANVRRFFPRKEILSKGRFQIIAGYLFHVGLFLLLFFAAPHILFIEEKLLGISWPAMPHWAFIVSAEMAIAGLIMLFIWRLIHPVLKQISTKDDYLGSVLVFIVMLTGCLALGESFAGLRAFHMLTVELLMIYFPFSRLMHAFTFIISRGYTGAALARRGVGV